MSTWYWVLLEQSANLVEAMMLVILLHKFFETKAKHLWVNSISVVGIYVIIVLINIMHIPILLNIIIFYLTGLLLAYLLFKGSLISRVLVPLLMVALITISEVITIGVLQITYQASTVEMMEETPFRMLGIIISKLLLIITVFIAGHFSKKGTEKIPIIYSFCILIVPVISMICITTLSQFIIHTTNSVINPFWFILSAFGLLLINLVIIYLFEAFMNYSRNQNKLHLMTQQTELLRNHLRETNILQEETHRIWHDMKNHFTVIQWMVKSMNYSKLDQYMQTLGETVSNSMLTVQSGNPILDALLNPKAAEAKKFGIEFTINACIPANISIEDIDLNIVFSNAMDNAMEACKKLSDGNVKFISVDANIKNNHLVLVVKNSFDGLLKTSGNELRTTKQEGGRHGIGMGNMKRTVEKYDGHINTYCEGNVFILTAAMYCEVQSKKIS